jgi:hypothetical protein
MFSKLQPKIILLKFRLCKAAVGANRSGEPYDSSYFSFVKKDLANLNTLIHWFSIDMYENIIRPSELPVLTGEIGSQDQICGSTLSAIRLETHLAGRFWHLVRAAAGRTHDLDVLRLAVDRRAQRPRHLVRRADVRVVATPLPRDRLAVAFELDSDRRQRGRPRPWRGRLRRLRRRQRDLQSVCEKGKIWCPKSWKEVPQKYKLAKESF